MRGESVAQLDLPKQVVEFVARSWGIENLHPPQAESLPIALSGSNLLLCAPTASGKSLVAHLAILRKLLVEEVGSRAIYIVPLKALASEKVDELKQAGEALGLEVGIAIGDRTGESVRIDTADIIVCTSEKFDSLLRNREGFLEKVSIVIADEVHLVNDSTRGPTLEVNLARIMHERASAQIVALSATVGNAKQVADWLNAELVTSKWRPVPLNYATHTELEVEVRKIVQPNDTEPELPAPRILEGPKTKPMSAILDDTIEQGGQLLCFVGTRRSAQSAARDLASRNSKRMIAAEQDELISKLQKLADKTSSADEGSDIGDKLVSAIKGGVAFHHAGLTNRQRKLVEQAFRDRLIVCICATPTLAAGVNLPARRVVVRDLRRWDGSGSTLLSVMEVQQMLGRAGRPQYDDVGEAWIHCKNLTTADQMAEYYFFSEPEQIVSKLHLEPPMRMHVLAAVATGGQTTRIGIGQFFDKTFLACDLHSEELADKIDGILDWLVEHSMLERKGIDEKLKVDLAVSPEQRDKMVAAEAVIESWDDELPPWASAAQATGGVELGEAEKVRTTKPRRKGPPIIGFQSAADIVSGTRMEPAAPEPAAMTYRATPFGELVSRLYLDPLSGHILRKGVHRATSVLAGLSTDTTLSPFGLLHLISTIPDFAPLWPRNADIDPLQAKQKACEDQILVSRDLLYDCRLDIDPLVHTKCATVLEGWIEEQSNREIERSLGVAPGDLRVRIDLAEWLLYACREIVRNDEANDPVIDKAQRLLIDLIDEVRLRVRNGCRADLLELVALRNVGRVRARTMSTLGIRSLADIVEMTNRDRSRLADERGWSPQLVEGIVTQARQLSGRRRRR